MSAEYINTHHIDKLEIRHLDGEPFYMISQLEDMRPFLMTIVSPGDHWMYIASNGGVTAGRRNPESALFPYYTDDMIVDMAHMTGSHTLVRVSEKELWEPFAEDGVERFDVTRNLYKNMVGDKVIFEEINRDLGLSFQYMWTFSERFGFIKKAKITALENEISDIQVLDGVRNIMPSGVPSQLQIQRSTLVDAYKRNELDKNTGLGTFSLSAMIIDKAEPSEALLTTVGWCAGYKSDAYLLSSVQLPAFRQGQDIQTETDKRGEKGAYFNLFHIDLSGGSSQSWYQVFDVNRSHSQTYDLNEILGDHSDRVEMLEAEIGIVTNDLRELVAKSDGLQLSNDILSTGRHFSNVLYNIMRGGIFDENYSVDLEDFIHHITFCNYGVMERNATFLRSLESTMDIGSLFEEVHKVNDPDLIRLSMEYLPLYFSRRHGDPSRPWNYFSIDTRDENGEKLRNYEGNWRDIFQNWEALVYSFPEYTESMIARFLNASTIDGYNPYRISRDGIDWEVEEEDDPWSYIGYWGDHQIIYLLKLLEVSVGFHPDKLRKFLDEPIFVYANVPYRIRKYHDLVLDPKNTIDFDHGLERLIGERVERVGADGKIVWDEDEVPVRASLAEKLLVPLCAKMCNFIPRGGIWLNTQRPEWNDANNALVGNGVSMVTLCYMRRYIAFIFQFLRDSGKRTLHFNRPVAQMIVALEKTFTEHIGLLAEQMSDKLRRDMIDDLGAIGEQHRALAYAGFSGRVDQVSLDRILSLLELTLRFCDDAIDHNKRMDGLYHAYNLLELDDGTARVSHLYEMLEGQVAVLSAGYLSAEEVLTVLDSLKSSAMYRPDQYSYMLYPDRELPGFLHKNVIPDDLAGQCPVFEQLVDSGDHSLVERDNNGHYHFSKAIHNSDDIRKIMERIDISTIEADRVVEIFESLFDHSAFTGRSGTFFGYEGLGSIYWHMVSKLLLAIQECIHRGVERGVNDETLGRLVEHYYEVRAGIGINKSPELYGAFPTDAYSHTPANAGAQQPGMTGQVKEDVISRWAELGINISQGCISFEPRILRKQEFLMAPGEFEYYDLDHQKQSLELPENSLAFTFCQVPVIYTLGDRPQIEVLRNDGEINRVSGNQLDKKSSDHIFKRDGEISQLRVICKLRI